MILVKGTYKGKEFDGLYSPHELIEAFELPIDVNTKRKLYSLELMPDMIKPDPLNGGTRHRIGCAYPTTFTGMGGMGSVQITYYKTQSNKTVNGVPVTSYLPNRVRYHGAKKPFSTGVDGKTPNELELLVYFMLYHKCKDSPFNFPGMDTEYQLHRPEEVAATIIAGKREYVDIYNKILGGEFDPATLRRIGYGLKLVHAQMSDLEVSAALIKEADRDMKGFATRFTSAETLFEGMLKEAKDIGVLVLDNLPNKSQQWTWSGPISREKFASPTPKVLCTVPYGGDAMVQLKTYGMTNYETFVPNLNNAISEAKIGKSMAEKLDVKDLLPSGSGKSEQTKVEGIDAQIEEIKQMSNGDLLVYAVKHGYMVVHEGMLKFTKGGKPDKTIAPCQESTAEAIAKAFTDAVEKDKKIVTTLKQKINGKLRSQKN